MLARQERIRAVSLCLIALFGLSTNTTGQTPAASMGSRDVDGRVVVHAMRVPEKPVIDGTLDEAMYTQVQPVTGFVQAEPEFGAPATEQTQLWVFFDDRSIYVGIRCLDSGVDRWSSLDMRRDSQNMQQGESVSIAFDTFHDKRNGLQFSANPHGGVSDSAITNERDANRDWNTIWESRTGRFDGGWTAEFAIPFQSLRYGAGELVWGVNVRRNVKWKNEVSYLNEVPLGGQFSAIGGLFKFSSAATLVGLETPPVSRLFEVKPYGISTLRTDTTADTPILNKITGNIGGDAKLGVTQGLIADFTYNTDFAQVEDDEQQVNLTRFSLFFPEKREFFLEGQGIFVFGGLAQRRTSNPGEVPLPFFSRRIGIDDDGHAVPILGGGRLAGRAGAYSIGAVNIQTKEDKLLRQAPTNFSVLRLRRDVLRRSNVGAVFVNRSAYGEKRRSNQTYGVDGVFSFFQNVNINTYYAGTETPELHGNSKSYRAQLDYNPDRYGITLERMVVGEHFNPEAGYVRRHDFKRNLVDLRFSPRPKSSKVVRKYDYSASYDEFSRDTDGRLETQLADASFGIEFQSSDRLNVQLIDEFERLKEPFTVFGDVEIPVGDYRFRTLHADYQLGSQHVLAGLVGYDQGGFYGGTKKTLTLGMARVEPVANLFVEPAFSFNWVDIPQDAFVAKVASTRVSYMFSPRMFMAALVQYNSNSQTMSTNARFRWEYRPGSDLFIVYSDGRNTAVPARFPVIETRTFTVKVTRFFRM
ncbi:MAG: carbohydrate binding family 9 domain-containing protein [Vicinamibacterales bacterium]|nr:carbohydrate binding family 9 domain-containing protein [Vicinamibacterales bacterium]